MAAIVSYCIMHSNDAQHSQPEERVTTNKAIEHKKLLARCGASNTALQYSGLLSYLTREKWLTSTMLLGRAMFTQ